MKVIDLLKNKNIEKNFVFFVNYEKGCNESNCINWTFEDGEIKSDSGDDFYEHLQIGTYKVNSEVVIIEEPKKIEKLQAHETGSIDFRDKINEIIDKVNKIMEVNKE